VRRIVLASFLVLGGCLVVDAPSNHMGGDSDASAPDASLLPVPATAACASVAAVACQGYESCCDTHSVSMSDCVSAIQTSCAQHIGPLLADSRTGYDPDVAAEVLAEGQMLVAHCDPGIVAWYSSRGGLERVFQGTVAGGRTCATMANDAAAYFSCRDLMYGCIGDASSGFTCSMRRDNGLACHVDADCVDADYCEGLSPGSNPVFGLPGRCQRRLAPGSSCTTASACMSYVCDTNGTHQCVAATRQAAYCGFH